MYMYVSGCLQFVRTYVVLGLCVIITIIWWSHAAADIMSDTMLIE